MDSNGWYVWKYGLIVVPIQYPFKLEDVPIPFETCSDGLSYTMGIMPFYTQDTTGW